MGQHANISTAIHSPLLSHSHAASRPSTSDSFSYLSLQVTQLAYLAMKPAPITIRVEHIYSTQVTLLKRWTYESALDTFHCFSTNFSFITTWLKP